MDSRIEKRLTKPKSCINKKQSIIIRQLSEEHKEEIGNYLLLSNTNLSGQCLCRASPQSLLSI